MIDIATGFSMLPPTACSMRNTISACKPGDALHSTEANVNSTIPTWNVRRRPKRSASEPESKSKLATTKV